MIVAGTEDLAEDIVRQIRELMQSPWYKAVFKTRISQGHSQKHDFSVEGGGRVRAVAVRSVTGKGGDYVIFDDAHNIDDWDNERKKQRVIEAFELLVSRRDRGKDSRMLVVGHRVAEDDVSAHILARGDFEHVCLPLYAPENMSLDLGDSTWELSKGEALRPDAFPPDEIDSIRRYHCGPPFWLFYQQGLGPRDGDFEIKVSDFPFLPRAPYGRKPPKELPIVLSVDPANKTSSSSRNVIHVYLIRRDRYELIRAWAEKCTSNRLAKKVLQLAARYDAWFPTGPGVDFFAEHFPRIQAAARAAGRAPDAVTGAAYVTLALDASPAAAEQRLHGFLETYYGAPARTIMARQATYAGPVEGCVEWLQRWIDAGARHISLRFAGGDQLAQVDEAASRLLPRLKRG